MSRFRGFTVSFNAIGSGKVLRKYLVLACKEMLLPLLSLTNVNMIEAKCSCQIIINTRAVFRKSTSGTWVKYQLLQVVAPNEGKHLQAKRLLEGLLPGSTVLQEYKDTARARLRCSEFVPDNKCLVFGLHRNGLTYPSFGEIDDLHIPGIQVHDGYTYAKVPPKPWNITEREKRGVSSPVQVCPLQRRLNIAGLLDMLLQQEADSSNQSYTAGRSQQPANRSNPRDPDAKNLNEQDSASNRASVSQQQQLDNTQNSFSNYSNRCRRVSKSFAIRRYPLPTDSGSSGQTLRPVAVGSLRVSRNSAGGGGGGSSSSFSAT